MQTFQVLIYIVAAALTGFISVDGLQCHQCDTYSSTAEDLQCVDPYINGDDNLDDCEDDDTHCAKIKTVATRVRTKSGSYGTIFDTGDSLERQIVISRMCMKVPWKKNMCEELTGAGGISITCYCDGEGCNSAPSIIGDSMLGRLSLTTFLTLVTLTVHSHLTS